jgi:hypothetical protein
VTVVNPTSFGVNSCPPNVGADCPIVSYTTFVVVAPDLDLREIPLLHALVSVRYSVTHFWACQSSIEVTSLTTWAGLTDDRFPDGTLLLAAVDGGGPFADSPYQVDRFPLGCVADAGTGCGGISAPDDYFFVFSTKAFPEWKARVNMGETDAFNIQGSGKFALDARNLRSYETGFCDDYWNYAYYLAYRPHGDGGL